MSALKPPNSFHRPEHLGDIDRLKSICFPKTPKTNSSSNTTVPQRPRTLSVEESPQNILKRSKNSSLNRSQIEVDELTSHTDGSFQRISLHSYASLNHQPQQQQQQFGKPRTHSSLGAASQRRASHTVEDYFDVENFKRGPLINGVIEQYVEQDPIGPAASIVEFMRRVGCQLNDLCLTKMSEKSLQHMIENHVSEVSTMQRAFSQQIAAKDHPTSVGLRGISECFEELVEKLGDLITRLRMFNKKKFKNLIETSLENTLREVFEENNRLNIFEIVTDINVFVNTQRKSLQFWKLVQIFESAKNRRISQGFRGIQLITSTKLANQQCRDKKKTAMLVRLLAFKQLRLSTATSKAFFKWRFEKQVEKQRVGELIEAVSRVSDVLHQRSRGYLREGFNVLLSFSQTDKKRRRLLCQLFTIMTAHVARQTGFGVRQMKLRSSFVCLHESRSVMRLKGKSLVVAISNLVRDRKRIAFKCLVRESERVGLFQKGLLKIVDLIATTKRKMMIRLTAKLASTARVNVHRRSLGAQSIGKQLELVFNEQIRSTFNFIRSSLIQRQSALAEVFEAVVEEVNRLENPSLRNVLRTIDGCFSNKRIMRHLQNIRCLEFKQVHMDTREVIQLSPIWKKLEYCQLHSDIAFAISQTKIKYPDASSQTGSSSSIGYATIPYAIVNEGSSSSTAVPSKIFKSIIIPLENRKNSYLVCESSSAHPISRQTEMKMVELGRIVKNRLKESFYREQHSLKMCGVIHSRNSNQNAAIFFKEWRESVSDRLAGESDQKSEKMTLDLQEQLRQYKVEIEKNKVHSSSIIRELGLKREEMLEVEARFSDLTIEKKAKSKCLATALFAKFAETKKTQREQLKGAFRDWAIKSKKQELTSLNAQNSVALLNSRHLATRLSSALYLLRHFQISYEKRLQQLGFKSLALNSVCMNSNNSALNFSQLNASHLLHKPPTPSKVTPSKEFSRLSPNVSSKQLNLDLSRRYSNNQLHPQLSQQQQQAFFVRDQVGLQGSTEKFLNFDTPQPSPINIDHHHNNLQQKPFFQSANTASANGLAQSLLQSSSLSNGSHNVFSNQGSSQKANPPQMRGQQPSYPHSEMVVLESYQMVEHQPALQLQPTQLIPVSQSSCFPLPHPGRGGQQVSLNSSNDRLSDQQQHQQQYFYANTTQKQQLSASYTPQSSNNHSVYYPGVNIEHENLLNRSNWSVEGGSRKSNNNRESQNRSYDGGVINTQGQMSTTAKNRTSGSARKQPSNLGYRLSAKTVNFLQKFGRAGQGHQSDLGSSSARSRSTSQTTSTNNFNSQQYIQQQQQQQQQERQPLTEFASANSRRADPNEDVLYRRY